MKVVISFSLDLSDTPYNIETPKDIQASVQDLSIWLSELKTKTLMDMVRHVSTRKEAYYDEHYRYLQNRLHLASSMFDSFTVNGITEDGKVFRFSHEEPGYKEELFVDGKLYKDE